MKSHEQLTIAHEEVKRLKNQLEEENIYLKEEIKLEQNFEEIVGESKALKSVLFKIQQVAPTDATVLITGETGTGKELVARAIHSAGSRADRPLVKVNCAALSSSLIETELFGHENGAFTGAVSRKIGRFELANGGTIFLDEIGELPLASQVKLLRIIQEGEFERLGSSKMIKVEVRIIAATNRNLEVEVEKGSFREDLWYRLNVFLSRCRRCVSGQKTFRCWLSISFADSARRSASLSRRLPPELSRSCELTLGLETFVN